MTITGLVRVEPSGIGRSDFTCPAPWWMGLKREAMPMEVRFWTQTPGDKRRRRRRRKNKRYLIILLVVVLVVGRCRRLQHSPFKTKDLPHVRLQLGLGTYLVSVSTVVVVGG